jgi:hypothetical protein
MMRWFLVLVFLVALGAGLLLLFPSQNGPQTEDIEMLCDWRLKAEFSTCMPDIFANRKHDELHAYLMGHGFLHVGPSEDREDHHYVRFADDLSNYRVVVLAWLDDDLTVSRLEIR